MSSLLRSSAMRRALSAALSGGAQGASLRLVPAARRSLALPTSPRRHLSGNNAPADSSSSAQVDVPHEDLKELSYTLHKAFLICGGVKVLYKEMEPKSLFAQWLLQIGAIIFLGFINMFSIGETVPSDNN